MNTPRRGVRGVFALGVIGVVLLASLFAGLMMATAGGAVYPPIVTVAGPFACKGEVETVSQRYSYKPGQQGISRQIFCRQTDGERQEITFHIIGYAFLLYSGGFFVLGLLPTIPLLGWLNRRTAGLEEKVGRSVAQWQAQATSQAGKPIIIDIRNGEPVVTAHDQKPDADIADRLRQLQQLLDQGLITQQDYDTKKTELLSQL